MQKTQDPLQGVLAQYAEDGWRVDYSKLTMEAVAIPPTERLVVESMCEFVPENSEFKIRHAVRIPYPLGGHADHFFSHLEKFLHLQNIDFDRPEPSIFCIGWNVECPRLVGGITTGSLTESIDFQVETGYFFILSCAHVLKMYACLERRMCGKLPPHMDPRIQICFCALGFGNGWSFS